MSVEENLMEKIGYSVLTAGTIAKAMRLAETNSGGIRLLLTEREFYDPPGKNI